MAISNLMTKSLLSAHSAMKQIKAQQGIRKQMEGNAGVLKAEIKQDSGRGGDIRKKEEELAAVEKKANDIENMQMNQMSVMNRELNENSKAETEEQKKNEKLEELHEKRRIERREQFETMQEKNKEKVVSVDGADVTVRSSTDANLAQQHIDESIAPTSFVEIESAGKTNLTVDIKV